MIVKNGSIVELKDKETYIVLGGYSGASNLGIIKFNETCMWLSKMFGSMDKAEFIDMALFHNWVFDLILYSDYQSGNFLNAKKKVISYTYMMQTAKLIRTINIKDTLVKLAMLDSTALDYLENDMDLYRERKTKELLAEVPEIMDFWTVDTSKNQIAEELKPYMLYYTKIPLTTFYMPEDKRILLNLGTDRDIRQAYPRGQRPYILYETGVNCKNLFYYMRNLR